MGFINELNNKERYEKSFMGQSMQQREHLLKTLNTGDLLATMNNVYKIKSVDAKNVILVTSKNSSKKDIFKKLTNQDYPETSFTGKEVSIKRSMFDNGMLSNTDMIVNILDN